MNFTQAGRGFYLWLMKRKSISPPEMAEYARLHTPFYRDLYRGADTRNFLSLPIVRKEMLRDLSPYELLSDEYAGKVRYYGETTGSLGSPTPAFYTAREFFASTRMARISPFNEKLMSALKVNRTCVNGITFGFTIAGMSFGELLANIGGLVANVGTRSTIALPERTARVITRLKPSIIAGTPLDLLCWMRIIEEDYPKEYPGVLDRLKIFISTAELCARSRSRRIEEEFGVTHVDAYACVEGFFSLPCPCGGKHILPIYETEVLDEDLKCSSQFGRGRFCFTNLLKRSSPMVRYLLDDTVTISESGCPHGFKKSILPHGRHEFAVRLQERILNIEDFEEAIFRHGLWGDYRVVIEEAHLRVFLEDYGASPDGIQGLQTDLEKKYGLPVSVEKRGFGEMTRYREVRFVKPILKLKDERKNSTQMIPEVL